jgi:ABC-type bacteriocin/lantibiotic exporter with double-glycine peptidase domain
MPKDEIKEFKEEIFPDYVGFFGFVTPMIFSNYEKPFYSLPKGYTSQELKEELIASLESGKTFKQAFVDFLLPEGMFVMLTTFISLSLKYTTLLILWLFLRWLYDPFAPIYQGYMFSVLVVVSTALGGTFETWKLWGLYKFGSRIKLAFYYGIYDVILKNCHHTTSGELSNLLSSKLQGIIDVLVIIPSGIASPFEAMCLTGALAYFFPSWVCAIPFILWLLSGFFVLIAGGFFGFLHAQYTAAQDDRIKYTSQFLFGIRMVKMSAWDDHFVDIIRAKRRVELDLLFKEGIFRSLIIFLNQSGGNISLVIVLILVIVTTDNVQAFQIFTVMFIMFSFQGPFQSSADLVMTLGVVIPNLKELFAFVEQSAANKNPITDTKLQMSEKAASIENGNFYWTKGHNVLHDINIEVKEHEKLFIVGMNFLFYKILYDFIVSKMSDNYLNCFIFFIL